MTQMELHIPDGSALDKALHKGVVKELHGMVKRSCENPKTIKNLAMGFLLPFQKVDDLKTIDMAIGRMREGYDQVMRDIVTSSLFNEELFAQILKPQHEDKKPAEGDQKNKDKGREKKREREKSISRSESSPKISKDSKPEKKTKPTPKETDASRPVCPACGTYISDKHNPRLDANTCIWVKNNIKGHNEQLKTVDWVNSKEYLEESKKGRTYLGRPRDREENRPNKEGIECDTCSPILNHLSNLPFNLPLIDILIPSPIQGNQKGKRAKLRAIRAVKEISRAKAFLDSGALGGNFISPEFAEELKLKGFKIEKLVSLCSIGTPDGDHNLSSHAFMNFPIICIDEFGIKSKIDIKAHIVKIK